MNGAESPRSVSELLESYYGFKLNRYTLETVTAINGGPTKVLSRDRMRVRAEFSVLDPAFNLYLRRDNSVANGNGIELSRLSVYVVDWKDDFDDAAGEFFVWSGGAVNLYIREVLIDHL